MGDLRALQAALVHLRLVNGLAVEDGASSGVHSEDEPATAAYEATRRSVCSPQQVAELFRRATLRQYRPILAELLRRIEVVYLHNGGARASWQGLGLTELESGWCPPSFEAVTILDLSRNGLVNLPTAVLRKLPNLRVLDLSHNALVHLPTDRLWKASTPRGEAVRSVPHAARGTRGII